MNDADGNPVYPRNGVSPPRWTGIYCQRLIPKPAPSIVRNSWGDPLIAVYREVCRGEIAGNSGEERCAYCGAVPTWS